MPEFVKVKFKNNNEGRATDKVNVTCKKSGVNGSTALIRVKKNKNI